MSCPSSNKVEDDAWLMKIELNREGPEEPLEGGKSKEAIGDQAPLVEQALPAEEEEEDILKPYYDHLTTTEIEAFQIIDTVHVQNKYLTRENILLQEHITFLWSVIRRLEYVLSNKDKITTTSSPPPPSSSPKEN